MERSGPVPERADTNMMELHPTPESWRVALFTALGSFGIALATVVLATAVGLSGMLLAGAVVIVLAALATFVPAIGVLTATVDADGGGVTIHRLGRTTRYDWPEIRGVRILERRASVPDGTEYHWIVPSRSGHVVAVPCLELTDGRVRQLPALAAPAAGERSAIAHRAVETLARLRPTTA